MPYSDDNLPAQIETLPTAPDLTLDRRTFLMGATLLTLPVFAEGQTQRLPTKSSSLSQLKPYLMAQLGHSDNVNSAAFSSDGRCILTGSKDKTARLWDAVTGKELCSLISFLNSGWAVVTEQTATKANFRAVLDILAGREVPQALRQAIPNSEKLRKAQPEDLLVLSFACHGDSDNQGNFYLFPYDIGPKQEGASPDLYAHGISSAELSLWLREVDAGSLAMIVDACHSAAAVDDGQFKPGPMGSRGLGQLAYDKGMRILAASQADDVAVESDRIHHGLLTYALLHDRLEASQADWKPVDKHIEIAEWLEYAEQRVPKLYEEVKSGNVQNFGREIGERVRPVLPPEIRLKRRRFQQPSLFDFTRTKDAALLDGLN